jgi:hypothetical protein
MMTTEKKPNCRQELDTPTDKPLTIQERVSITVQDGQPSADQTKAYRKNYAGLGYHV